MYYRKNIDMCLKNDFTQICDCKDELQRIKKFDEFFRLSLDSNCYFDYEIIYLSDNPISITVKHKEKEETITSLYENSSTLLNAQNKHIKFINVSISLGNSIEREKTYYRFDDGVQPLHDEVSIMFDDQYRLTLSKKTKDWYRPIEVGIYITLSDAKNYITIFHGRGRDFFNKNLEKICFEFIVQDFIKNKDYIFNKLLKKLEH